MALHMDQRKSMQPQTNTTEPKIQPNHRTVAVLPSFFTLGNCLCGFLAIFFASRMADTKLLWDWTPLTVGAVFVFTGMLFDALDGRIARRTGQTSELGEQLDSMADMVTFGVAPAFLAVQLVAAETPFLSAKGDTYFDRTALIIACIYVACAAIRLARFTLEVPSGDQADHLSFEGLPSPGAAGTVASLVLLHQHFLARDNTQQWTMTLASIGMVIVMLMVALVMVSRLRYVHVTNRYLHKRAPLEYIAICVIVGLLLAINLQGALAASFVTYALSTPLAWCYQKMKHRAAQTTPNP